MFPMSLFLIKRNMCATVRVYKNGVYSKTCVLETKLPLEYVLIKHVSMNQERQG